MFYKIYFWFYIVFSFLMLSTLRSDIASFILALSQLILLLALYSNGYKKDFFSETFWKISFICSVLIGVVSMLLAIIGIIHYSSGSDLTTGLMVASVITILSIPAYISLYIYVFKKRKVFSKINKPLLWKIYFWFLLIVSIGSLSFYIVQGFFRNWDIIDLLISAIAMLGLYAFCWNKKILNQIFWKIFFLVAILWTIVSTYILPPPLQLIEKITEMGTTISQPEFFLLSTITLTLILPRFLTLYYYAFKNKGIWKNERQEKNITNEFSKKTEASINDTT